MEGLVALVFYLTLAGALFADVWRSPFTHWVGSPGDPQSFMWFLSWFPYALGHGLNPFFSDYGAYPAGANLVWDTGLPLISVALWPVTAVFGPVLAYNLMITLAPALSAWTCFLLLGRVVRSRVASTVGGLIYGFSPFMFAQSLGHPQLTMAFMPPLILLLLDEIIRVQRRSALLMGAALGAAGAAQFLIGEEVLVMTGICAIVLLVIAAALWPAEALTRARSAAGAVAVAGGVFAVLVGGLIVYQLFGPRHMSVAAIHGQDVYVTDLLNFLIPTHIQWLAPGHALRLTARFSGNLSEWDGYIGVPMAVVLIYTAIRYWTDGWVRLTTLTGSVLAIMSLGVTLHVGGTARTWLPAFAVGLVFLVLPGHVPARVLVLLTFGGWFALLRLPLLDSLLPGRLMLLVFLMAGAVVAVFADRILAGGGGWRRRALSAAVLASVLLPLAPRPLPITASSPARFFDPGGAAGRIPAGSVAVIAPVVTAADPDAVQWQATAGMRFRMPEGYLFIPAPPPAGIYVPPGTPSVTTDRLIAAGSGLADGTGDPRVRSQVRNELASWHVRTVIVGPMVNQDRAVALMTWALGRPPELVQGVYVWWDVDRLPATG